MNVEFEQYYNNLLNDTRDLFECMGIIPDINFKNIVYIAWSAGENGKEYPEDQINILLDDMLKSYDIRM